MENKPCINACICTQLRPTCLLYAQKPLNHKWFCESKARARAKERNRVHAHTQHSIYMPIFWTGTLCTTITLWPLLLARCSSMAAHTAYKCIFRIEFAVFILSPQNACLSFAKTKLKPNTSIQNKLFATHSCARFTCKHESEKCFYLCEAKFNVSCSMDITKTN